MKGETGFPSISSPTQLVSRLVLAVFLDLPTITSELRAAGQALVNGES